jgi:hypothetical protein
MNFTAKLFYMKREKLIKQIKANSLIYQNDNLERYTDQQLNEIMNCLFLDLEKKFQNNLYLAKRKDQTSSNLRF